MRNDDTPAALPLICYACALAWGAALVSPRLSAVGILCIGLLRPRWFVSALMIACGLYAGAGFSRPGRAEARPNVVSFESDRFTVIEAPLDRDWSRRGAGSALRVASFRANGEAFDRELLIYTHSSPPPIALAAFIRAEGFVQTNERGALVMTVKSSRLIAYRGTLRWWQPSRWNRALAMRLARHADQWPEEVALAQALALGRGERLDDDTRDEFRRGGTYHLLVFSGMQIAFAAAAIAWLLRWFLHKPRVSDWLLLTFAVLAPLFIGGTASVVRASVAIGLYAVSRILGRPTSLENLWCVSALLRLMVAPADLTDPAFHLTYAGAGALLFLGKRRWLLSAIAVEAAITPLTLWHFRQYAIAGSAMTLLLSPIVFAMLIVSAATCVLPCDPLFALLHLLRELCAFMNDLAAPWSGYLPRPPLLLLLAAFAVAFALRRRPPLAIAALLLPTLAAAAWPCPPVPLTFLDVGQGDAILVRDRETLLVDGGPQPERLLALLADRGVRRIDLMLLTHAHPDHCTGLPAVIRRMSVGELWLSPRRFRGPCAQALLEAASEMNVPIHLIRDSDHHSLGSIVLTTLVADRTFRRAPENNSSVVVRLQLGARRVLLTGDIERDAESALADRVRHADILKVPHHGSRTSTTAPLLDAVAPRLAVISCGRRNLFGHPHAAVVHALEMHNIRTWRTDRSGSVEIGFDNGHIAVRPQIDTPPPRF
ncbi:MAG TPA: ComEC/Rec2 family competence protein [Thermoanaerobaculia bacterium]|nr:ComEC/Rec2 family competence protein [Thermoanaerobaculia bacterium]